MEEIIISTLRLSVPLVFAAYAGLMSERSGVANIALEAYLLFGAFTAAATTALTGNLVLGIFAGILAAGLTGFLFGVICIWGKGDQIVVGTAFNLLATGILPVLCKAFFGVSGSTPSLPLELRWTNPWTFILGAVILAGAMFYLFRFTVHGIRIIAAGENPDALITQGVSYKWVRLRAVTEGAILAGIGGVYLSLCQGSGFVREMSAGRGFIALAALIFGSWKPIPTFAACLFFGFADAMQMRLQGQTWNGQLIPNQFVQIIPYVVTLLILFVYGRNTKAPAAINRG